MPPPTDDNKLDIHRLIVENTAFGLVLTDLAGNILYANPRQCESSGYTQEELTGQNARIFQSGQTPTDTYRDLWVTILAGGIWHGEMLNRRKNGETVREYMRVSPVRLDPHSESITHFLAVKEEHLIRNPAAELAGRRVTIDTLTGLPNRAALFEKLEAIDLLDNKAHHDFALLLLDIDGFHLCNERFGPMASDQILIELATRLTRIVRTDDFVARLGGDKFALMLRKIDTESRCAEMARRILDAVAHPVTVLGDTRTLTASIGIVRYPADCDETERLLQCADLAVTETKNCGGNDFRFYAADGDGNSPQRRHLMSELRHVVNRGELRLHFQPQASLVSGKIVGLEALIRWQHPERGLVPPNAFIPLAEEAGLIIPISEWVLREACQWAKRWRDANLPAIRVAVNLSARHFRYINLPDTVASVLSETGIEPKYLELEMTESAMMHDPLAAVRIVDRLKNIGVHISLDDFGTGYSSLAYLSRFAIDRLKIDQTFIGDVTNNPVNASIATATIAMAHKLGKIVVAEGVETEAQMQFLRRHDCDEMQGYYFSKPLPAEQIADLLGAGKQLSFGTMAPSEKSTLLLVDDEPNILNALRRLFRREGYRVLTADSGARGLELLALNTVDVIISDQRMPEMSGVEFLSRVKDLYPETVRIVLSGYSELSTVTDAINRGAIWKYITKPWDDETLLQEVRAAFLSRKKSQS